jgi:hypothetical protein
MTNTKNFSMIVMSDNTNKIEAKITKTPLTKAQEAKEKFFADGHSVPNCVNPNCFKKVQPREWKYWSFKSECSSCSTARKQGNYIFEEGVRWIVDKRGNNRGIIIHKEMFCENIDGHLGFACPVPKHEWINFQSGLDLDHVNGNHYENEPENVRTYCKLCHNRKSVVAGDCNSKKPSARKIE